MVPFHFKVTLGQECLLYNCPSVNTESLEYNLGLLAHLPHLHLLGLGEKVPGQSQSTRMAGFCAAVCFRFFRPVSGVSDTKLKRPKPGFLLDCLAHSRMPWLQAAAPLPLALGTLILVCSFVFCFMFLATEAADLNQKSKV